MDQSDSIKNESHLQQIERFSRFVERQNLSTRQTQQHISWVLRFLHYYGSCQLDTLRKADVERYLSHLALSLNASRDAQIQAHKAIVLFFNQCLDIELGRLNFTQQRKQSSFVKRFGMRECQAVIEHLNGTSKLVTQLAAFTHIKLKDILNLRIADIDFKKNEIVVRHGNGQIKMSVNIPMAIILDLRIQSIRVHSLVQQEKERELSNQPTQLAILAEQLEPEWQYLFPYGYQHGVQGDSNKRSLLNQMPISVIKNDIQIAIQAYRRTQPNVSEAGPNRINRQLRIRKIRSGIKRASFSHRQLRHQPSQIDLSYDNQLGAA